MLKYFQYFKISIRVDIIIEKRPDISFNLKQKPQRSHFLKTICNNKKNNLKNVTATLYIETYFKIIE